MCGMVQAGDGAGFALEALAEIWAVGEMRREDFDGDDSVEARVARAIDLSHAAGAQGGDNLVGAEFGCWREGHGFRSDGQLVTTVMAGIACCGTGMTARKRWPSAVGA